jgi:hypothetical protein
MKTIHGVLFFSIILSVLLFNSCSNKPTESTPLETKIAGKITDKDNNNAISGAQITTNPTTSSVTTDASGDYTISNVSSGQYVMTATKAGYKQSTISVVVTEGKTASADLQLEAIKPELAASVPTIDFGTSQINTSFTISNNSGVGTITWTAATSVIWLSVSPTSGTFSTSAATITVTANRSGLPFGNYTGTINLTSNAGNITIPVTLSVLNPNAPQLTVSPTLLQFGDATAMMIVNVQNTGTGKLTWSATPSQNWISLSKTSDSITTGLTPINVTVTRSSLSSGSYSGQIAFSSNGGSQTVNVTMNVPAIPTLSVSPSSLDFDSAKTQLPFSVSNTGSGSLTWSVASNQSWMTINPVSGTNAGTVNVSASRNGLSPGNYSGIAAITSNGGNANVTVTMRVAPPSPPTPVTLQAGAVTTNSVAVSWTTYGGLDFAAYKLYYSISPVVNESSTLSTTILQQSTSTYTISGLNSNTPYYFRAYVMNQNQITAGSNTVTAKTEKILPTWQQVALPVNFQVQSMHYISESNIWVAGYTTISGYNFPRIFQFNGSTWTQSTVQGQDTVILMQSIAFRNNSEGWATSSNRIYKYDGSNWNVQYYLSSANLIEAIGTTSDVWFYGDKKYRWDGSQLTDQGLGSVSDMHFYNSTTGFQINLGYEPYLFNGTGWLDLGYIGYYSLPGNATVSGTSKNDVWASNSVYLYHYDGISWTRQNDIGGNGIKYYISQIRMTSPAEGWASTTSDYIYYYNGTSWNKVGTVSGELKEIKDFGNGNLWGIIYGSTNKLMRLQ